MKRLFAGLLLTFGALFALVPQSANALSNDPKLFISADNTFYAYVKSGETIGTSFIKANWTEPFSTTQEDVTVTLDGPGVSQQKCVIPKNVAVGQGCRIADQTAEKSGVWRVQFSVPKPAKTYDEVSPTVKWGGNWFNWTINVKSGQTEQKGRIWTERYAIRQPGDTSYATNLNYHYISEDGYIYRATYKGYNGQISTLSADAVGIRSGDDCESVYQSVEVSNTKYSPALGSCGSGYKLFLEEPSGELPPKAKTWEDKDEWVRPNISRPAVSELSFDSDRSKDQQSGSVTFFLRNFIGQYQIKIDVDNDGQFDGQNDVVLHQQMKRLSEGLQRIRFDGTDKTGQIIPPSQTIGIKVEITKVAEIHFVAADVEGRTGGLDVVRISGDNAPTTGLCWNDTELPEIAESLMTPVVDGRSCPDSTGGVHEWAYADNSWGNARYIEDWVYASAKLQGNNQTTFPLATEEKAAEEGSNLLVRVVAGIFAIAIIAGIITVVIIIRNKRKGPPQLPPPPPAPGDPNISSL